MLNIMLLIGFILSSWASAAPLTINRQLEDEKLRMRNAMKIMGITLVPMMVATQLALNFEYWAVISYLYLLLVPVLIGILIYLARKKDKKLIWKGNLTILSINSFFWGYFLGLYLHP